MAGIRVLVVDDSAVIRKTLTRMLNREPSITVVGTARDAYQARDQIVEQKPDVVTLDLQMPRMDGLTFLKKLMKHHPVPVVVVSSLSNNGSDVALEAVQNGAVEVMAKPSGDTSSSVLQVSAELCQKIKAAARVDVSKNQPISRSSVSNGTLDASSTELQENRIVAIGASTGGVQALKAIIPRLPKTVPGILIAQHMPEGFTRSFAQTLDRASAMKVSEAEHGEKVKKGRVYLAPGNYHLTLKRKGGIYRVRVRSGPRVNNQRPSCDVLFRSVAEEAGDRAVGIILTGMGQDGARGLKAMHDTGARTIGQDEDTSTVYGMPREAYEQGAVDTRLPLKAIPSAILRSLKASLSS